MLGRFGSVMQRHSANARGAGGETTNRYVTVGVAIRCTSKYVCALLQVDFC
jgi:hypothetical protein